MIAPHTHLLTQTRHLTSVKKILTLLDNALENKTIDSQTHTFLKVDYPIIPVFYFLLKVHKNLQNPPGRPIVTSTDYIFSPLAKHLEKILTPLIKNTRSYLRDTNHFLETLHAIGPRPKNSLLVILDVNSLYTSI